MNDLATASAAGLTLAGVATGLEPHLLMAGFAGGVWSQLYMGQMPAVRRALALTVAPFAGATISPIASISVVHAAERAAILPPGIAHDAAAMPLALLVGLLAHRVLGRSLIALARRRLDKLDGGDQ